jgi:O-acetylhomoserine/O-acetylserine sulfhydrylase-like pyridoxal-dependent enzyme
MAAQLGRPAGEAAGEAITPNGFGGMLSFQPAGGRDAAVRVAANLKLFRRATSLGGTESLVEVSCGATVGQCEVTPIATTTITAASSSSATTTTATKHHHSTESEKRTLTLSTLPRTYLAPSLDRA